MATKPTEVAYRQICQTVKHIPRGAVASYGQIADLAGLPGRARMVSKALRAYQSDVPLPWHRVLRSNGQIAFPAGSEEANTQVGLLQEDGIPVFNHRISMKDWRWQPDLMELLQKTPILTRLFCR